MKLQEKRAFKMATNNRFKAPRQLKFDKNKINPLYKEEKPIGISFDHASKCNYYSRGYGWVQI